MKAKCYSFHLGMYLWQNDLQFFNLKKNSSEQEKKLTSPYVLEGIFVYLYRDRVDITVPEHVGKHFIASDHGGCEMAVHFDYYESDREVISVVKTFVLSSLLSWSWRCNIATFCQLMKGENWSASMVSVAWKKSNVATAQTTFSVVCVDLGKLYTFVLSSYTPVYWCQEDSFELSYYSTH